METEGDVHEFLVGCNEFHELHHANPMVVQLVELVAPYRLPTQCASCSAKLREANVNTCSTYYQVAMPKKLQRIIRQLSPEERARHAKVREVVQQEFPPKFTERLPAPPGIPATIRAAREAQGLTWYALAQLAGIPNQATIRDIEQGKDVRLSNLQAVAKALKLELELVTTAHLRTVQ